MFLKKIDFFKKIHIRMGLTFALFYTLSLCIIFVWIFFSFFHSLQKDNRQYLNSLLLSYWAIYQQNGREAIIRQIRNENQADYIVIVTNKNKDILTSYFPGYFRRNRQEFILPVYPENGRFSIRIDNRKIPLLTDSLKLNPNLDLRIILNTEKTYIILKLFQKSYLEIIIIFIIASFLTGTMVTVWALRPINLLNREISSLVENTDVRSRLKTRNVKDQLADLIIHINLFLDRIELLVGGMKQALDNTAHDLRTPLTRMKVKAETVLLKKNATEKDLREAIIECLEESDSIIKMMNTILDITEAEKGLLNLRKANIDIKIFIAEITDLYQFIADEKRITINREILAKRNTFKADPVRMRQIIGNILDNAVKYSPEESAITISVKTSQKGITFKISDEGSGINSRDLPRIWDRLYRGENDMNSKGLGLGLSLVKALVDAHKGTITVHDRQGKGTSFAIFIPDRF